MASTATAPIRVIPAGPVVAARIAMEGPEASRRSGTSVRVGPRLQAKLTRPRRSRHYGPASPSPKPVIVHATRQRLRRGLEGAARQSPSGTCVVPGGCGFGRFLFSPLPRYPILFSRFLGIRFFVCSLRGNLDRRFRGGDSGGYPRAEPSSSSAARAHGTGSNRD